MPRATLILVSGSVAEGERVGFDMRQPVRVLQVVRPAVGGMKGHVLQLATGLRAHGFECEIACPGDSELVQAALEANLLVHPVPIVGPLRPRRDLLAIIALREVIRERRPALIHAHGSKAGLIARLAARHAGGSPIVVTVHNQVLYGGVSRLTRRVYIMLERWLARRTARIITVSDALRAEMLQVYGLPASLVTTIHNGVDLSPFLAGGDGAAARERYGIPRDALVFGLAARFAPQKAHKVLVEAAEEVLERDTRAWALLAGDGPLLERARSKARAGRVRDRILFPGFETDVPGLLAALDVYASPAIAEGLGLATIEAMAAGLPVVSTTAGGTSEVVEDGVTGLLVPPGKPVPLAAALTRLLRDPVLRRTMGEAGRTRAVAEFGEDRMLERTARLYREVLG
jgi:glycosyltransferase involved in cell wall biosynthesis